MKGTRFWNTIVPRALSTYALTIFAVLWIGMAVFLVVNRDWFDLLWDWVRALPAAAEFFVWLLFLPVMVGLWAWEASWSDLLRFLAFAAIAGWTLVALNSFVRAFR